MIMKKLYLLLTTHLFLFHWHNHVPIFKTTTRSCLQLLIHHCYHHLHPVFLHPQPSLLISPNNLLFQILLWTHYQRCWEFHEILRGTDPSSLLLLRYPPTHENWLDLSQDWQKDKSKDKNKKLILSFKKSVLVDQILWLPPKYLLLSLVWQTPLCHYHLLPYHLPSLLGTLRCPLNDRGICYLRMWNCFTKFLSRIKMKAPHMSINILATKTCWDQEMLLHMQRNFLMNTIPRNYCAYYWWHSRRTEFIFWYNRK